MGEEGAQWEGQGLREGGRAGRRGRKEGAFQ